MNAIEDNAASPFDELFFAVEDLLRRIADTEDLNIRHKRARLRAEMIALREEIAKHNATPVLESMPTFGERPLEFAWSPHAWVALAGAAMALTVFQAH